RTRDGEWIALSASTPASARALFDGLGLGDLMKDPRFATNDARVAHNDLVDAALARAIGARTLDEMLHLFETMDLTAAPVYDIADITEDPHAIVLALAGLAAGSVTVAGAGAEYAGPLIDAHSHLSNAGAIDAYVEAMKRHNVTRVVLLGVGGVQKDDAEWIVAAARKYPDRVIAGLPVPDPTSDVAAQRLADDL